jgi:DENN (AEX-3) domain/uDENN domain/dDENN domain
MTTSSSSQEHVADYYAILGVGDVLEWKHTTKQQQQSPTDDPWEARHLREVLYIQWSSNTDAASSQHWSILKSQATNDAFDWSSSVSFAPSPLSSPLYLTFQRRQQTINLNDDDLPAIADLQLFFVRIPPSLILMKHRPWSNFPPSTTNQSKGERPPLLVQSLWKRCTTPSQSSFSSDIGIAEEHIPPPPITPLAPFLELPRGFQEWCIPEAVQHIYDPAASAERPQLLRGLLHPATTGVYLPVMAVRRQRVDETQCYHEDTAITDLAVGVGVHEMDDDDEEEDDGTFRVLGQSPWITISPYNSSDNHNTSTATRSSPTLRIRRNRPSGLCETPFATRVLGRFPEQNYSHHPLPEEELPMFCYPTGCTLHRTEYCAIPQPESYGFVVKNERGDSLHVACVSFMEPLTPDKRRQLDEFSYQRRKTSLPHRKYWERRKRPNASSLFSENVSAGDNLPDVEAASRASSCLVTAFSDMTIFENKTICLISRYPFWTAFRKFLSHLHVIAGASLSDIPLERYISHLLLAVPLPRPGGPAVLVPLPALHGPIVLNLPPEKDFPLLDLPYSRLFSCLDIQTIVTLVLGLLTLERKVIILSTRPSLVLDVAELLRSLLFPFELCAPYVPRLTEPFKSSLHFPGAIFVGIHDDGDPHGLAASLKASYPEESIVVNLDTGEMDCEGDDRFKMFTQVWYLIPHAPRSSLVAELEALCRDVDLVPGQEPLESLVDSAFHVDLIDAVEGHDVNPTTSRKPLDDRGVRDAFLRFFCSILGGYERCLVVPDADFLVSGDEWFDAAGFLAAVRTEHAAYLTSLVSTQLFQAFVQRRTEASDVHCLLFDECLAEYHSSPVPYGRLGGDVEAIQSEDSSQMHMLYSLLVDQSAAVAPTGLDHTTIFMNKSMDASDAESSFSMNNASRATISIAEGSAVHSESALNFEGELVTVPSRRDLPPGKKYMYCVDGNPCFPHHLNSELFLPREPSSWVIATTKASNPLLARSERELEEANRRRRMSISKLSGIHQRRCLWQLPKLMGSHFLGSWLLCVPALVSQPNLSHDQQSRYLLRALGALRLLRSKQRIVPDEAAYRALMVACGRTQSDRRVELVKLFGLLRSDGIFPSAVTLGQYTKALAEGYSKRVSNMYSHDNCGIEVTASNSREVNESDHQDSYELAVSLDNLDTSLFTLEHQGRRWRQRNNIERGMSIDTGDEAGVDSKVKRFDSRIWHPVVYSSSFNPHGEANSAKSRKSIRLLAIWSRTRCCTYCSYVPLDEEIQAGWDVVGSKNDIPGAVACPRCDSHIVPMLGFRELSLEEALAIDTQPPKPLDSFSVPGLDFNEMPPQINPSVEDGPIEADGVSFVAYINPVVLREALEQYVEEYGDEILGRDRLKDFDPEIFINFWWYCARFSLPLPLPMSSDGPHLCAFAAWDRCAAERGCNSAAKVIEPLLRSCSDSIPCPPSICSDPSQLELFSDLPLLAFFNLQGFYAIVWEHPDLSKLLVSLVEACDKRDFRNVLDTAVSCNKRRRDAFNNIQESVVFTNFESTTSSVAHGESTTFSVELDIYKVLMYLAKYQCTSAFHTFFPATTKPCKGYHFWCAIGTPLPNFDRLFREAKRRANTSDGNREKVVPTLHDVSDVALAFRCVFGHLI